MEVTLKPPTLNIPNYNFWSREYDALFQTYRFSKNLESVALFTAQFRDGGRPATELVVTFLATR
jgi:hypothetical protein